jgi:hypothetical protein
MAQIYKGPLDYIDVATRIVEFREKYPTGSLQQVRYEFVQVAGKDWIIYTAAAFRTPDDIRPGMGTAWEPIPGPTNFTRDSEVQNAETAAWGRAIVAVLAADTRKGIASSEEVRNRQEKTPDVKPVFKQVKAAPRVYSEAEISYAQTVLAEIESITDRNKLRELWTREKELHECKVNGTTILDAINQKVAVLPEEMVASE